MDTGFGTFVLSWSQVELDGERGAALSAIRRGATWTWTGEAVRLAGSRGALDLGGTEDLRGHAVPLARRLPAATGVAPAAGEAGEPDRPGEIRLTDGHRCWTLAVLPLGGRRQPLVVVQGSLPPRDTECWIVSHGPLPVGREDPEGGVICFTPGTCLLTPDGPRPVESLREGDRVQTVDDGPAEILWIGRRRVTGARMQVMPRLAPIRLREGALDRGVPDAGLLVSPDHRLVLRGPRARDLFGAEEILVRACDLLDGRQVRTEQVRDVTYIHLLLPQHGIVLANGVETESFHPASAALASLGPEDRERLLRRLPTGSDPRAYGPFARRLLDPREAAILRAA
ncbi:Hint domain-containing protein [Rubellimicrobium sp. CFH 75288]|uniref:Hint domain-containing protein n=1 Tax=Rubellimicrobium sp. CFH 75288 TaxID=2697034 RepID=UPI00141214CD|nr:Hint domain-containing protein [Rubellimicrobium sp. CFH 75288]NAZ35431.1 hemolysin-type calcium-binding protein [Rubellimicrobium sp. CFH 75288]